MLTALLDLSAIAIIFVNIKLLLTLVTLSLAMIIKSAQMETVSNFALELNVLMDLNAEMVNAITLIPSVSPILIVRSQIRYAY